MHAVAVRSGRERAEQCSSGGKPQAQLGPRQHLVFHPGWSHPLLLACPAALLLSCCAPRCVSPCHAVPGACAQCRPLPLCLLPPSRLRRRQQMRQRRSARRPRHVLRSWSSSCRRSASGSSACRCDQLLLARHAPSLASAPNCTGIASNSTSSTQQHVFLCNPPQERASRKGTSLRKLLRGLSLPCLLPAACPVA